MTRVLLIGKNSILTDVIEASFAHEPDLDLFRLPPCQLHNVEHVIRDSGTEVVICEEETIHELRKTTLQENHCLLFISISPHHNQIQVCQSYKIPNPGMHQMLNLVRDFNKNWTATPNYAYDDSSISP